MSARSRSFLGKFCSNLPGRQCTLLCATSATPVLRSSRTCHQHAESHLLARPVKRTNASPLLVPTTLGLPGPAVLPPTAPSRSTSVAVRRLSSSVKPSSKKGAAATWGFSHVSSDSNGNASGNGGGNQSRDGGNSTSSEQLLEDLYQGQAAPQIAPSLQFGTKQQVRPEAISVRLLVVYLIIDVNSHAVMPTDGMVSDSLTWCYSKVRIACNLIAHFAGRASSGIICSVCWVTTASKSRSEMEVV
jgi:hypothetical protein